MATWKVDSEMSLRHAVKNSGSGDTILVKPGDYHITMNERSLHDIKIDHSLTIMGDGGRANFYADQVKIAKGIFNLVLSADDTVNFDNIGFLKAHSSSWNGAGIRHNGGDLNVTNSYFADCDMGILSVTRDASKRGDVTVTNSEFNQLGFEKTHAHALYVLANNFTVENNYIHDTIIGHHVKSVSANTIVRNNILDDGMGTSSYAVDVGAGGDLLISGNTITQGINGDNKKIFSYQAKRFDGTPGKIVIEDNHIINLNEAPQASRVLKNTTDSAAEISNNKFEGFDEDKLFMGPFIQKNNTLDGKLLDSNHSGVTDPATLTGLFSIASAAEKIGAPPAVSAQDISQETDYIGVFYAGHDDVQIPGGTGAAHISVDSGDDLIFDYPGVTYFTGSSGVNITSPAFNTDRIWDISTYQGDGVDLGAFLPDSFNPMTDALDEYIRLIKVGYGANQFELRLDIDGPGKIHDFVTVVYLQGRSGEDYNSNFTFNGWDYF
jgi:hypothetical protein